MRSEITVPNTESLSNSPPLERYVLFLTLGISFFAEDDLKVEERLTRR